jgi:hypothetical protein
MKINKEYKKFLKRLKRHVEEFADNDRSNIMSITYNLYNKTVDINSDKSQSFSFSYYDDIERTCYYCGITLDEHVPLHLDEDDSIVCENCGFGDD